VGATKAGINGATGKTTGMYAGATSTPAVAYEYAGT
jgi:hypothetical protein